MVCVLPVPGGPYSSRPRLRCWPAASSASPVAGHSEGVPLDPRQHGVGQHDVVPADAGRAGEREDDAAHRDQRHVEQVAAVDVELGAQLVQLGEQALGQVDRQAGHLDLQARLMLVRGLDHHDVAAVADR